MKKIFLACLTLAVLMAALCLMPTAYAAEYETGQDCPHEYAVAVTSPTCTERGYTTYTCACGESYVNNYVNAVGHTYENGNCTVCGAAVWDTDGDGILEILAIGNSFSVDALEYAYPIAQDLGIEKVVIGNLYIGGCSLSTHASNATGDKAKYVYYYNDSGAWSPATTVKSPADSTISGTLESRSWDYVSLQQSSTYSGVESTYNKNLTTLIDYVKARSNAKLVWHMTWAYQQDSTHSAFPSYGNDQMTMYNAIVSAVQNKIVTNADFDLIVPNGTAVQNSRTSILGDTTTRDDHHMSYDYGRYLTGLMFIKTITNLDISGIAYAPSGVDADEMAVAIESVNNAYAHPFMITESEYVSDTPRDEPEQVPEEGYILLQTPIYQGAFWHPMKDGRYNELIDDQHNSPNFFTTIRFTRETLPVGSIILLESGWQYRPDGWVTDTLQSGSREGVTTAKHVVVTEQWWENYTIRSFNVSRTNGGSVMELTEEDMRAIFRIYVPIDSHSHVYSATVTPPTCTTQGFTTHTCVCGESYADAHTAALGHSYRGGVCTNCQSTHPNLLNYKGKVISVMGDSISTFAGYIPTADGFNLAHRTRYPDTSRIPDVTNVNQTWWMQVVHALDAKLGINESWAGSTIYWGDNMSTKNADTGEKAAMASLTRIQNLGANGTPDVIFLYGGGNDKAKGVKVGSFDPAKVPAEVDLTCTKWDSFADSCVAALMRMRHYYPDAEIVVLMSIASAENDYIRVMRSICEHFEIPFIFLNECGLAANMHPDGSHPNDAGMDVITDAILDVLCERSTASGENTVYTVTHQLTYATASKQYYKGVSAGASFAETVDGEGLHVRVTMGGADITADCCADGRIEIPCVTGDLVIAASGVFSCDGHLQQLPERICAGTNIWNVLEPENIYYTVNGWGLFASQPDVHSVTFPVKAGERIWATSFQKIGTAVATRITWFGENGLLRTVAREDVYAEFAANGYITVPEGAFAVNIPMGDAGKDREIYLLDRAHDDESGTCTLCGAKDPSHIAYGDLDGNGTINTADVVLLRRYIAGGYGVEISERAADLDGDGMLNTTDVVILRRYIAGGYGVVLTGGAA